MSARPVPSTRAPWDAQRTSGEVRTLESEVESLRESLRRPPSRDEEAQAVEAERRALVTRIEALEERRVAVAAARETLRARFDAAVRSGLRRDGRLRALGGVLGFVLVAAAAPLLFDVIASAPPIEPGAGGPPGIALLLLAALGLGARLRRRG